MTFLAFLGALSLSLLAFELMSVFQSTFSTFGGNRLMNVSSTASTSRRSTWEALLVAILPGWVVVLLPFAPLFVIALVGGLFRRW